VSPRTARLGTGALVLAALSVGQVMNQHLPTAAKASRPFEHQVGLGQTARLRSGDLVATAVDGGTAAVPKVGTGFRSPGVVLDVTFAFTARAEPSTITYGELRDSRGRTYPVYAAGARGRVWCRRVPAGLTATCHVVVEAPADALPGAHLALAPLSIDTSYDDMAVVDLAVTRAQVTTWAARTQPLQVPDGTLTSRS
jgi:hypothetical protein